MKDNTQVLDKAVKEYQQDQQEELRIGYDNVVDAQKSSAAIVEFRGEEYQLPKEAPGWVGLMFADVNEGDEVDNQANMEMIERLLGVDFARKVRGDRAYQKLKKIMQAIDRLDDKILEGNESEGDDEKLKHLKKRKKKLESEVEDSNYIPMRSINEDILQPVMENWGFPMDDPSGNKKK